MKFIQHNKCIGNQTWATEPLHTIHKWSMLREITASIPNLRLDCWDSQQYHGLSVIDEKPNHGIKAAPWR